jgi:hypothetical protein
VPYHEDQDSNLHEADSESVAAKRVNVRMQDRQKRQREEVTVNMAGDDAKEEPSESPIRIRGGQPSEPCPRNGVVWTSTTKRCVGQKHDMVLRGFVNSLLDPGLANTLLSSNGGTSLAHVVSGVAQTMMQDTSLESAARRLYDGEYTEIGVAFIGMVNFMRFALKADR